MAMIDKSYYKLYLTEDNRIDFLYFSKSYEENKHDKSRFLSETKFYLDRDAIDFVIKLAADKDKVNQYSSELRNAISKFVSRYQSATNIFDQR